MKRTLEIKNDGYKFNLINALEKSVYLPEDIKSELSKLYKITLRYPNSEKKYAFSLSQIRNITVHPEDDRHRFAINQIYYKELALLLLDIAPRVHESYHFYLNSQGKGKRKEKREKYIRKFGLLVSF